MSFPCVFDAKLIAKKNFSFSFSIEQIAGRAIFLLTHVLISFVCSYHIHLLWHKFAAELEIRALEDNVWEEGSMSKALLNGFFLMLIESLSAQQDNYSMHCLKFKVITQFVWLFLTTIFRQQTRVLPYFVWKLGRSVIVWFHHAGSPACDLRPVIIPEDVKFVSRFKPHQKVIKEMF